MDSTKFVTFFLCMIANCYHGNAEFCHGKPHPDAKPNMIPIYTTPPTFLRQVENGKLYKVGSGEDEFYIAHVYGNAYQMGYAQGKLQPEQSMRMINQVWDYFEAQVEGAINSSMHFQKWFLKDVADLGLDVALDLEIDITAKYTGQYFRDEIRGLSNAVGLDYQKILRIHLIGELTKGACSMLGAWGESVPVAGSLLQLRALDWSVDGPFKDFPQVTVYHPDKNDSLGHAFANFGWTGWVGSITGMSSEKMAISEIGVSYPDDTFGRESRFGVPFTFLLRDILQFDKTLDDSIRRITNSKRTCDLILGVGDGKIGQFRGIEYSASVANFFNDQNMQPAESWHPRMNGTVYYGMDWLCPNFSIVLARQIKKHYGNVTAENVIRDVVSIVQTGNLQVAVYNLTSNVAYLSNAKASYETGAKYAYDRQFIRLDMAALFAEKRP